VKTEATLGKEEGKNSEHEANHQGGKSSKRGKRDKHHQRGEGIKGLPALKNAFASGDRSSKGEGPLLDENPRNTALRGKTQEGLWKRNAPIAKGVALSTDQTSVGDQRNHWTSTRE